MTATCFCFALPCTRPHSVRRQFRTSSSYPPAIMRCRPGCWRLPLPPPTLLLMTSSTVWVNRDAATGDSASFAMADRLAGEFQKPANGPAVLAYFTHTFVKSIFYRMYLGGYQFLPVINCCWRSITSGCSTHRTPLLALS